MADGTNDGTHDAVREGELDEPFGALLTALDGPVLIVTTRAGDGDDARTSGCLVGFAAQCSIHPPRHLVCLSKANHTFGVAAEATFLVVHAVPRAALDVARLFAEETGDEIDKFERCAWHVGPGGVPVLDDCPAWYAGRVLERVDLGDHVGHLLEPVAVSAALVVAAEAGEELDPDELLHLRDVLDLEPGHDA
jgi:flavin reductase (DIM6/NTAB) family NADH-FMN oxidoreductase RutF